MHRIIPALLPLLMLAAMPAAASALTDDTPPGGNTTDGVYCPALSQTLTRGMRDSATTPPGQVTELQKFLSDYYDIDPEDIVTGYFGALTQRYVKRFQREQGLPAYGIVGTLTRAAIARVCGSIADADSYRCQFNGQTIADGESVTAYASSTVPYGRQCLSERRTCIKGVLSGSHAYASCSPAEATNPPGSNCLTGSACYTKRSCTQDGVTLAHGASRFFYSTRNGLTCTSELRTCTDGTLSGSYPYASCAVGTDGTPGGTATSTVSCTFNGQTIADGESVTAYASSTVPYGRQCLSERRTCIKGVLSGSYEQRSCSVSPGPGSDGLIGRSCTFNGQTIANGSSIVAYLASSVAVGGSCVSQARTCSNGILSGSYAYANCTVAASSSVPMTDANCEPSLIQSSIFSVKPNGGKAPLPVTVSFAPSSYYQWTGFDFGDGTKLDPVWGSPLMRFLPTGPMCTRHTYATAGTYTIRQVNNGMPIVDAQWTSRTVTVY